MNLSKLRRKVQDVTVAMEKTNTAIGSCDLTIIVCTYRRPREVGLLLTNLVNQLQMPDEILVIDSSPDFLTQQAVSEVQLQYNLPVKYVKAPIEHHGLTRQRNYGISLALGDIIAFLDDDTVPEPDYCAELLACFARNTDALGIGGYITGEKQWYRSTNETNPSLGVYRYGVWECREDYRWRLRKLLGLESPFPPGWMSRFGYGRTTSFLPPDGNDHRVELLRGCAFALRREVFERHLFSKYFEGYGLGEDYEFSLRVSFDGNLYVCTRAQLAHKHAPSGRPNRFHYGVMIPRNGWFIWRRRWPHPSFTDYIGWWSVNFLMTGCRIGDVVRGPRRRQALSEVLGRTWGMFSLLWNKPVEKTCSSH